MRFSMMSHTMTRRPKHFDLQEMLELTRELDLDRIDFVRLHGRKPRKLRKMDDGYGIPVVAHTFFTELDGEDPAVVEQSVEVSKSGIEAAVILGAPVMMLPILRISSKGHSEGGMFGRFEKVQREGLGKSETLILQDIGG